MKIIREEYSPNWKEAFEVEKKVLAEVLREFNPLIEHVGGNSVEGLCAKPIIDINIGVKEPDHLDQSVEKRKNCELFNSFIIY
ncbi:MAG: hypothetical protein A7316_01895 [Candidatus Altiarchaeales archaeon WOR_SM1_86-2]|nr:MAG: hypothetical protein A7316_01895 [Candidatus Altiarchaeales archaeon WOR_SM1_86-2]ODS38334.1 MAG: hypothetical protein A7315_12525 [Candidatus Altiarchaeales archaeon WOR_SM1_79]